MKKTFLIILEEWGYLGLELSFNQKYIGKDRIKFKATISVKTRRVRIQGQIYGLYFGNIYGQDLG